MRTALLSFMVALAVVTLACSRVDACRLSCKGCCDARGGCQQGQPWACGAEGSVCTACEPGQACSGGACVGAGRADLIEVLGTNNFVPRSAQAFRVTRDTREVTSFIAVSSIERPTCRDPYALPVGEVVLLFSEPNGTVDPIALLTPFDGGVRHDQINGSQGIGFGTDFARVDFDIRTSQLMLNGTIEAPLCGEY